MAAAVCAFAVWEESVFVDGTALFVFAQPAASNDAVNEITAAAAKISARVFFVLFNLFCLFCAFCFCTFTGRPILRSKRRFLF